MLIVSKYHDYYDGVAKSKGVDKAIVYERKQSDIEKRTDGIYRSRGTYERVTTAGVVGFCGKIYPVAYCFRRAKDNRHPDRQWWIYDLAEIHRIFVPKEEGYKYRRSYQWWIEYLEVIQSRVFTDIFHEHRVPIFLTKNVLASQLEKDRDMISLNPRLSDVEFQKVVDPFTAFQEIEMYISGVLGVDDKKILTVSDADRLIAHGFSKITSFRKDKHQRKG